MVIPDWIDTAAWSGYVEMRKLKKAPMTERAKNMIIRKLKNFREWGQDPNAILDQSTLRCWTDVYPINDVPRSAGKAQLSADDREYYKKLGLLQ